MINAIKELKKDTKEKETLIRSLQSEIHARDLRNQIKDINNNLTKTIKKSADKKAGFEIAKKILSCVVILQVPLRPQNPKVSPMDAVSSILP